MIVTEDLSKEFDGLPAVDGVTLQVGVGEVLALLGPNGAGKTTTVRMLTSILRPTRGWARVAGFDVVSQGPLVRSSVGILTEQHGLYGRMPAGEYLEFFGQLYGMDVAARRKRINRLLEEFGLAGHFNRRLGEFSKGMRQKLALARALLHEPPVLLLDEPTSAMDPESARLVRDAIHALRSAERAIVICSHNLAEAEELADQIAIIRRGRLIAKGSSETLKNALLGPPEYEIHLASRLNGRRPEIPSGVDLTAVGEDWLRFRSDDPRQANPRLLENLLRQGLPVVQLKEVERNLEQVYLQAISAPDNDEVMDAG